jgi:hypothetical protein
MTPEFFFLILFFFACPPNPAEETDPGEANGPGVIAVEIRGHVLTPDGIGVGGAEVLACQEDTSDRRITFCWDATTKADGSFVLQVDHFPRNPCKIRLTASHEENFWLPTGVHCHYPRFNGTEPVVDLAGGAPPGPVDIRLGLRGGKMRLRIRDEAQDRYIKATLYEDYLTPGGILSCSTSYSTGKEGAGYERLVVPGDYAVRVEWIDCHGRYYSVAKPPFFRYTVRENMYTDEVLTINSAELEMSRSHTNPDAERCKP